MVDNIIADEKGCMTCLYVGTHERCTGCLEGSSGGTLYKNRLAASFEDALDRKLQFEKDGKLNIVIGGQGEAEVNTKWTPEETFNILIDVAEQCGYLIMKEGWSETIKTIVCCLSHGCFLLEYIDNELVTIKQRKEITIWNT